MWFSRFLADSAERIDKKRGWSKLPLLLALPVLIGLRDRLRARTSTTPAAGRSTSRDVTDHPRLPTARARSTARTTTSTTR